MSLLKDIQEILLTFNRGLLNKGHHNPLFEDTLAWSQQNNTTNKNSNDPMRVIIEPNTLKTDNILSAGPLAVKNFEFRPQSWEQFIGQPAAKERVKAIETQFNRGMRAHIILSAIRGHGKSSFIQLLARDMNLNLIERIGNTITVESLVEIINEINTSEKQSLFFLDEIDTCPKEMIKLMNPVIESFSISGKSIKPFLFACASINNYVLYKNNPDFLDRIQHHIHFTRYSVEDLEKIIVQVHEQLYKEVQISSKIFKDIAMNCKYNPRTAINLLEYFVVTESLKKTLEDCGIVKDGLTHTDIKILEFLASMKRPVGSNAIAMKCSMSQREYENEWEAFLYEFGYILRAPSRTITDKGLEFLKEINK